MNALHVDDLLFSYGEKPVLDGLSLRVRQGEICCLIGTNGCGKSTLLDCVLGYLHPERGLIEVQGENVHTLSAQALARLIAYVPQVHARSFPYTVAQLVLMGRTAHLERFGAPDAADYAAAEQAMAQANILHLAERPCTQISGGEMQMVALARALAQQARVILMDEPAAHLDYRNELLFLEQVERLLLETGVTVLMATHAPNHAYYFESRGHNVTVAAMSCGAVAYRGAPREVLTPEILREIYAVETRLLPYQTSGGTAHQIVPIQTLQEGSD
ncbi:MAG: ABC transporter ATP-binding protein [Oscillospiraceae bacterium]|nr:ABC transporter ATP-binding protein [Oscillospiraceae bacterium]